MKTMKDYHDLYLKSEVLLLADVFGKFRNNSLKNYGFSRRHYLSAPALGLDAILNITKVELELISDPDMHIFFEKGTRGGVFYISIRNINANNLYGFAMSKFLPTSSFKWIDPKEFDLNKCTSNSSKGCVLEVNLEYQKKLQELRNNYLLT